MNKLFFYIFITMLALTSSGWALWTDPPLPPGDPFLFMWNSPTENCEKEYGIKLDLTLFPIISTTVANVKNLTIGMYYFHRIGIYPHIDVKSFEVTHGGVPQEINMTEHLLKATTDILDYMPSDIPGLGVLDFEEWRPLYKRNWRPKDVYRDLSKDLVRRRNPQLSESDIRKLAEVEFDTAARTYFTETIRLAKRLCPKRLWGYYLFPDCYNHNLNNPEYDGKCIRKEQDANDELKWLWDESTALFPSIYVTRGLHAEPPNVTREYIRHRVQEAIRVSTQTNKSSNYSIPIHPYIRSVNKDLSHHYLNELALTHTIGEAASLGAASVICWADMAFTNDPAKCRQIQYHMDNVMNPYVLNVSTATRLCSEALCQSRGRCLRKNSSDDVYLHVDPRRYKIERVWNTVNDSYLTVTGSLSQEDVNYFDRWFDCMCFSEEPCRSVKTFSNNNGLIGPHPVLLMMTLICLMYVMMCT